MPVSVKICGLNNESAVQAVIAAGADYAGFVHFATSPRHVSFEQAAVLKKLLPPTIESVAVLVDPDDTLLAQAQTILAPDYIQLHGEESLQRLRDIKKTFPGIKIIKAISISNRQDIEKANAYISPLPLGGGGLGRGGTLHITNARTRGEIPPSPTRGEGEVCDMLMFDAKPPLPPLPSGEGRGEGPHKRKTLVPANFIKKARSLRKSHTDAENLLWYFLRNRGFANYKFRRQHPIIGNYILDFYCEELKLAIELDGSQHMDQKKYDDRRTEYLNTHGIRLLRFWNNEVLQNTEAVLEAIWNSLPSAEGPSPGASRHPLPVGEGTYMPGGNALSFDWALLKDQTFPLPWFLSGGLTSHNVASALRISGATMVDVSSGVERSRGVKDEALIKAFVKAAKT